MSVDRSPGGGQAPNGATGPPEPGGEVARPDAGGDAAVAAPGQHEERRTGRIRARGVLAAVLVILFAILLPVTLTATWAHRTVVNTDAYVATITPIAASPEVQAAASRAITNQIYAALNPQQIIADALPPKAAPLAGGIVGADLAVMVTVDGVLSERGGLELHRPLGPREVRPRVNPRGQGAAVVGLDLPIPASTPHGRPGQVWAAAK